MYYATKFWTPDPYLLVEEDGKKTIYVSRLEYSRAKKFAAVGEVKLYEGDIKKLIKKLTSKAKTVEIPVTTPIDIYTIFQKKASVKKEIYPREVKSAEEIEAIKKTLKVAEICIMMIVEMMRKATVKNGLCVIDGIPLEISSIKKTVIKEAISNGCIMEDFILSSGPHTALPHHTGEGYIYANVPLVIDIYPRSMDTFYYADITRTVIKGMPEKALEKQYYTVIEAQELGIKKLKSGIKAKEVAVAVEKFFEKRGYKTDDSEGFIHSLGHGVGLEIHEPPRISKKSSDILKENMVVTVEPGLYYRKTGGVRVEDTVVVGKEGAINLTDIEKDLII